MPAPIASRDDAVTAEPTNLGSGPVPKPLGFVTVPPSLAGR
jgi:hypothetical protein